MNHASGQTLGAASSGQRRKRAPLPSIASTVLVISTSLAVVGCGASGAKMNAYAPIEKRSVFLGTVYEQDGKMLDGEHMTDTLAKESNAREDVSSYRAFSTIALILASAGGALIGWPAGEAVAGDDNPIWALAGVGAGAIVLSIPFGIIAGNQLEDAVDAHNRKLGVQLSE